jgi:hypothetical protein
VLFDDSTLEGIRDGTVDLQFRRWTRPRVKPGTTMRTKVGVLRVDAVDPVPERELTAADAHRAGFATRAALLRRMAGREGRIHRIVLHHEGEDPRIGLRARADVGPEVLAALERIDAGERGPWARAVLALIAARPEVAAVELAPEMERERLAFKRDVRRLKELGLTESLERGYRLSPRGRVALRALVLRDLYAAFNARDIDAVLGSMTADVDWPNAWEGGRLRGREAVRDYWTRQWAELDPTVEPEGFAGRGEDVVAVDVHQVVRAPSGALLSDGRVIHVYGFRGDVVTRMDVEEP